MFNGFSPEACTFLHNVEAMNSRQWYQEHKDDYIRFIRDPYYELITELTPLFLGIDRQMITEPPKCLSRIYRDTRFSKSKLLYRSSTWLSFKRPSENWLAVPCFYFELTDRGCSCGMGYYSAKASSVAAYRKAIADDPESFMKTVAPISEDPDLFLHGERYKRPPAGCPEIPGVAEWYGMKNFYVTTDNLPVEKAFSSDLKDFLSRKFTNLAPLYEALIKIETQRSAATAEQIKTAVRQEFEW